MTASLWAQLTDGCTDPEASNYNPDATEDDGSCEYYDLDYLLSGAWAFPMEPAVGYIEFDGTGLISDFSVFNYTGGWYNVVQNADSDTTFFGAVHMNNDGTLEISGIVPVVDTTLSMNVWGDMFPDTLIFPLDKIMDPGLCEGTWLGNFTGGIEIPYFELVVDGSGHIISSSGIDSLYSGRFYYEEGNLLGMLRSKDFEGRIIAGTLDGNIMGGIYEADGAGAMNFTFNLTRVTYTGCMDNAACNYNIYANQDDGSCEYASCDGTLLVPSEYSTIQSAIDAAVEGDSVLVSAGTYSENINFNGKNIALIGEDRETTIIDGGHNGSVVTFDSIEGTASALSNFTITGGNAYDGGGIYCSSSAPTIKDNIITGNVSDTYGGGISCNYSSPIIMNNTITSNSAIYGGGISFDRYTSSVIKGNNIHGNSAEEGGGIGCFTFSSPTITNNTIVGNSASTNGGGIYCYYVSAPNVTNTIIWDNTASTDPNISVYFSDPYFNYCDVMGSWEGEGNIDADPLFCDAENGDFTLQEDSPCIDAGTADLDGDGYDDITDYFGSAPDMGAFEYESEYDFILGDVNFDNEINILDVVLMVSFILGEPTDEYEYSAADVNQDGLLNILDIVALINIILGN